MLSAKFKDIGSGRFSDTMPVSIGADHVFPFLSLVAMSSVASKAESPLSHEGKDLSV